MRFILRNVSMNKIIFRKYADFALESVTAMPIGDDMTQIYVMRILSDIWRKIFQTSSYILIYHYFISPSTHVYFTGDGERGFHYNAVKYLLIVVITSTGDDAIATRGNSSI